MLSSKSEISESGHCLVLFSFIITHDEDVLKFVLHALHPPWSPTREHINGVAFLLTCARDTQKVYSHEQNAARLTR